MACKAPDGGNKFLALQNIAIERNGLFIILNTITEKIAYDRMDFLLGVF